MARGQDNNRRPRGGRGGRGRGRGGGQGAYNHQHDVVVQKWFEIETSDPASRNGASPRSGRGGPSSGPNSGRTTPRGQGRGRWGNQSRPRGQTFQRGRGSSRLNPNAPLSTLLYESRPLLRPVVFVRSIHTRTLFEQTEDILQTTAETVDTGDNEENTIPTADRIARVFSGGLRPNLDPSPSDGGSGSEAIEEIDFADMATFCEKIEALAVSNNSPQYRRTAPAVEVSASGVLMQELQIHISSGSAGPIVNDSSSTIPLGEEKLNNIAETDVPAAIEVNPNLTDSTPTQMTPSVTVAHKDTASPSQSQLEEDDEDIIVYEAPHPRIHNATQPLHPPSESSTRPTEISAQPITPQEKVSPIPEQGPSETVVHPTAAAAARAIVIPAPPPFDSVSFSFANSPVPKTPPPQQHRLAADPAASQTKARKKARSKEKVARRKRRARQTRFSLFGAIVSETQLRAEGPEEEDPRWDEQRRGDSDVDWGDDAVDAAAAAAKAVARKDVGAMDLDPDLEISIDQMKSFVNGLTHGEIHFVTMDDIADVEKLRQEDESDEDDRGSSGDEEVDAVVDEEEKAMIGETDDPEVDENLEENTESEDDSSDDGLSPRAGFQARLERLRRGKGKLPIASTSRNVDSSEDDDDFFATHAAKTEDYIAQIEDMLDQEIDIVHGHNRKARKKIFRAIENGDFDDFRDVDSDDGRGQKKWEKWQIPPSLQPRWELARLGKAEKRRLRRQALLEQAADPFSTKKGGKKSRKLIRAAAELPPSDEIPYRIFSIETLEQQIRRFVDDIGGPQSMAMPPMDNSERKTVHEIAQAFGLKSKSKGYGAGRYTTIWKTSRTGINVDERKVKRFVGSRDTLLRVVKNKTSTRKPKDGDEVGKTAPKIDGSNVGFRMLQAMGWSEGKRVGLSGGGGLDAPLVAVIKNTKLGLGANR